MRRFLVAAVAAGAIFLALGGHALAASCFVANKPLGAGEQGVFSNEGGVDVFSLPVTPGLEDAGEGVGELPEGAHNAGPGDNFCDGIGVDDAAC